MTDTTTLAPCPFCGGDANIRAVARDWWKLLIDHTNECMLSGHFEDAIVPQEDADKAELANRWNHRAAPASGEPAAYRLKDDESTKHYGKDVYVYYTPNEFKTPAAFKYLEPLYTAPPAQEALLNPDMPTQELRLHMGELTTDEVLVARAAIRWANSQQEARMPLSDEHLYRLWRDCQPCNKHGASWHYGRAIEAAHGIDITTAQKETPCAPTP